MTVVVVVDVIFCFDLFCCVFVEDCVQHGFDTDMLFAQLFSWLAIGSWRDRQTDSNKIHFYCIRKLEIEMMETFFLLHKEVEMEIVNRFVFAA